LLPAESVANPKSLALFLLLLALVPTTPLEAADSPATAFRREWQGRTVTVQRILLTLVYDERSRLGGTTRGKREGLVVATPSKGSLYLFAGRREVDDLSSTDPDQLFQLVKTHYRRDRLLEEGHVQVVSPLHLVQYEKGIQLVVRRVEIDKTIVRLVLFKPESTEEMATTLTIAWPTLLSPDLEERGEIERIISGFLVPSPVARR
jgi:hypothetical protein